VAYFEVKTPLKYLKMLKTHSMKKNTQTPNLISGPYVDLKAPGCGATQGRYLRVTPGVQVLFDGMPIFYILRLLYRKITNFDFLLLTTALQN